MQTDAELARNRRTQDTVMAERHRGFDLSARDNHMKYERPSFSVVGEGTREAQTAFHRGYTRIDWSK
jgi:hypothetical protein